MLVVHLNHKNRACFKRRCIIIDTDLGASRSSAQLDPLRMFIQVSQRARTTQKGWKGGKILSSESFGVFRSDVKK